jgi:hypothetical protein
MTNDPRILVDRARWVATARAAFRAADTAQEILTDLDTYTGMVDDDGTTPYVADATLIRVERLRSTVQQLNALAG